jgi:hypothetical protein
MQKAIGGGAVHAENHPELMQVRFLDIESNTMHISRHKADVGLGYALAVLVQQLIDDAISSRQFPIWRLLKVKAQGLRISRPSRTYLSVFDII